VEVLLDDRASVAPRVLDLAEKEAARIYRHTGIQLVWLTGPKTTSIPPGTEKLHAFTVRLIVQPRFLGTPGDPSSFLMGAAPDSALDCGGTAYVFFDQIVGLSSAQRADTGLVLGTVAAHEIGHLLLRRRGHAVEGLMHAPWSAADWQRFALGLLLFSSRESETMRTIISSCH
jgi:hypothetical protein